MTEPRHEFLLFSPLRLRGFELKNRIVISPMCQYSAVEGVATDWHMVHLGQFATGGAGLIFTEATAVEERGRITHGDLGLWRDNQSVALRRIVNFIKLSRAVPGIQLAHAGRKASIRPPWHGGAALDATDAAQGFPPWQAVAPSALAYDPSGSQPRALDTDEIPTLVKAWRDAARRARDAGFEAVEVHAAHGYLIHQFLSVTSNKRIDAYGGNLAGRMRLLFEIVEGVRTEWPADRPVFVRLSIADDADPDWSFEDVRTLVMGLKERGVDVIDCSSGGIGKPGYAIRGRHVVGYQIGLAAQVRRATGMTCMAVGLITRGRQAEEILRSGQADVVAVGREALVDPHWALHAAAELGIDDSFATWPRQYGWWLDQRARALARIRLATGKEAAH
jgi:2,4-dienoyl-CoA reductase-like NADH-dependent reductase (Old Yellow Enzyme family)